MKKISKLNPDVVMVALGVPVQEKLIYKHLDKFNKALESGIFDIYDINNDEKEIKEPKALESEEKYSIVIPIQNKISDKNEQLNLADFEQLH